MAIPAFAETEYEEIVITVEDIYNMAQAGDFTISYEFQNSDYPGPSSQNGAFYYYFTPTGNRDYTYGTSDFLSYTVNQYSSFLNQDVCLFYAPVLLVPGAGSSKPNWNVYYNIVFPFGYYLRGSEFYFSSYFGDDISTSSSGYLTVYDEDGTALSTISESPYTLVPSTFATDTYLSFFYSSGTWSSNIPGKVVRNVGDYGLNSAYFRFSPSFDVPIGSLQFSSSVSWSDTSSYSSYGVVPAFMISSITGYVEAEVAPIVEQYLEAIAGPPSPENQQKINDLKDQMQDIDDQLKQDASDMQVEIPDISDVESTIPEELTQGNEIVSQQVLSPIFNAQPIATIFLGVFAIVSLKLFLFGSGPH